LFGNACLVIALFNGSHWGCGTSRPYLHLSSRDEEFHWQILWRPTYIHSDWKVNSYKLVLDISLPITESIKIGLIFFFERYQADIDGFWLTPGITFLILYGLILVYFLIRRQFLFVLSGMTALALAYVALFWTVDGLRVFAVIIAAPYGYLLIAFIQSASAQITSRRNS
jgi:hypothetical protein